MKEGVLKMVNKKSKKIVLVILAVLILFCCTILLKAIYKVQSAKKADISKNVLTWVIPESISLDQKKIKKFNETLYQDGYDFCVKFETLEEDDFDRSVYKNELEKVLKEKKADIVYGGTEDSSNLEWVGDFCKKGYYYALDDYLKTKEGKRVYQLYPQEYWDKVKYQNKQYAFPNVSLEYKPAAIQINKDYIKEQEAKAWDGEYTSFFSMIEDANLPKDVLPIYPLLDMDTFALQNGYECIYNIFVDYTKKEAVNPFSTECLYQYFRFLHQAYEKKLIPSSLQINSCAIDEKLEKQINMQKIAIDMEGVLEKTDATVTFYSKFALTHSLSDLMFICTSSSQKKKALQLLSVLREKNKYANLLLWGEKGTDYTCKQDVAEAKNGQVMDYFSFLEFGLNEHVYASSEETANLKNKNKKWLSSEYYQTSKLLSFQFDTDGIEEEIKEYQNIVEKEYNCWKEKDFDKAYHSAKQRIDKKGSELFQEVNRQIKLQG